MSGELEPDATGTYERAADHDGKPTWTRQDAQWSIWYNASHNRYFLSQTIGQYPGDFEDAWYENLTGPIPPPTLWPWNGNIGTAYLTEVPP